MVIRNLRRFTESQHAHEYPLCSRLISDFEPKEVLYLAGLFHDIAKGRGGDHSTLGAADARRFCRAHGVPPADTELDRLARRAPPVRCRRRRRSRTCPIPMSWRPSPIASARERRLIALYLLTVADIRGTSPKVWNAWKAQLLEDLYHLTRARLAGTGVEVTLADSLLARQREAQRLLRLYAVRRRRRARAVGGARQRLLPAAHGGRDRLARAAPALARCRARRPSCRRGCRGPKPGCRSRSIFPTRSTCSPGSAASSGGADCRSSKPRSTRRGTAMRSTRSRCTIPATTKAAYRDAIQIVEFELAQVLKEERPARAAHQSAARAGICATFR